ncbi:Uncharacterised protein [Mycobacteroides abscessus subsp. abscessus]|nr:Uncharacterised protein [Mycobacteroides abscessus subsp. abscessus]
MCKSISADNSLVRRYSHTGQFADQAACSADFLKLEAGPCLIMVLPYVQSDGKLFQRSVPGPFPDAVDRPFNLSSPIFDGCKGVGNRHAKIIMAMSG